MQTASETISTQTFEEDTINAYTEPEFIDPARDFIYSGNPDRERERPNEEIKATTLEKSDAIENPKFQFSSLEDLRESLGINENKNLLKIAESGGGDVLSKNSHEWMYRDEQGQMISITEEIKGTSLGQRQSEILEDLYNQGFSVKEFSSVKDGVEKKELHIYFADEKGHISYEINQFVPEPVSESFYFPDNGDAEEILVFPESQNSDTGIKQDTTSQPEVIIDLVQFLNETSEENYFSLPETVIEIGKPVDQIGKPKVGQNQRTETLIESFEAEPESLPVAQILTPTPSKAEERVTKAEQIDLSEAILQTILIENSGALKVELGQNLGLKEKISSNQPVITVTYESKSEPDPAKINKPPELQEFKSVIPPVVKKIEGSSGPREEVDQPIRLAEQLTEDYTDTYRGVESNQAHRSTRPLTPIILQEKQANYLDQNPTKQEATQTSSVINIIQAKEIKTKEILKDEYSPVIKTPEAVPIKQHKQYLTDKIKLSEKKSSNNEKLILIDTLKAPAPLIRSFNLEEQPKDHVKVKASELYKESSVTNILSIKKLSETKQIKIQAEIVSAFAKDKEVIKNNLKKVENKTTGLFSQDIKKSFVTSPLKTKATLATKSRTVFEHNRRIDISQFKIEPNAKFPTKLPQLTYLASKVESPTSLIKPKLPLVKTEVTAITPAKSSPAPKLSRPDRSVYNYTEQIKAIKAKPVSIIKNHPALSADKNTNNNLIRTIIQKIRLESSLKPALRYSLGKQVFVSNAPKNKQPNQARAITKQTKNSNNNIVTMVTNNPKEIINLIEPLSKLTARPLTFKKSVSNDKKSSQAHNEGLPRRQAYTSIPIDEVVQSNNNTAKILKMAA